MEREAATSMMHLLSLIRTRSMQAGEKMTQRSHQSGACVLLILVEIIQFGTQKMLFGKILMALRLLDMDQLGSTQMEAEAAISMMHLLPLIRTRFQLAGEKILQFHQKIWSLLEKLTLLLIQEKLHIKKNKNQLFTHIQNSTHSLVPCTTQMAQELSAPDKTLTNVEILEETSSKTGGETNKRLMDHIHQSQP